MTEPNIPVTEDELHAYVDNELPAERRGDVEAWLTAHPDDAARVQSWRAMAEALHARYDSVADEAVPKRLEIERLGRQARPWGYCAVAASLRACMGGGGGGGVDGARRRGGALDVPEFHGGCARCAPAVRGRGPSSRRSTGQRTHASAAMADQALRLGCACAGTGRRGIEAGRRTAVARPHRAGIVPDV